MEAGTRRGDKSMIAVDPEAIALAAAVSRRNVRARLPAALRNENPAFRRRGSSFDLKSLREFQGGDDPRRIDWKLQARTGKWFVKEYYEEESERAVLLVDASASMGLYPREQFLALVVSSAYILSAFGFVVVLAQYDLGLRNGTRIARSRSELPTLARDLEGLELRGRTDLAATLITLRGSCPAGRVLVFSDFLEERPFDPETPAAGLFRELWLVHCRAPFDAGAVPGDELSVRDPESGQELLVPWTAEAERGYREREAAFSAALEHSRPGRHYALVEAAGPRYPFYRALVERLGA